MNKYFTILILTFLLCSNVDGKTKFTQIRNVSEFTKVDFVAKGNVNIRIGSEFKVVLEGEQDYLSNIETTVSNGKLTIKNNSIIRGNRKSEFKKIFSKHIKITVNITMPAISGLAIYGFGDIEVFDSFKTDSLSLRLSGEGKLILNDVSGEYLNCRISGVGRIIIQGKGSFNNADVGISGIGRYVGEFLKLETAKVNLSGIGKCICYVSDILNAHVSGIGGVTYSGSPKVYKNTSGIGYVSLN